MKRIINILIVIVLGFELYSQNLFPKETSHLLLDRALFVSGEVISFSGVITIDSSYEVLSEIVYIELIDPLGNKISQQKRYLSGSFFSGEILIPESTISGNYFLRAYTKWMRNESSEAFDKVRLKIVNPFLLDVQQLPDTLYSKRDIDYEAFENTSFRFKSHYGPSEVISLNLSDLRITNSQLVQLSVIPEGSQYFISSIEKKYQKAYSSLELYPETRGISLSGTITIDNKPSAFHTVYLNVMGEKDFQSTLSDSLGRFNFNLPPKNGLQELMLGASNKKGTIELFVDNDFEASFIPEKVSKFVLSEEEEKVVLQLARQYQINKWYFDSISKDNNQELSLPFYKTAPRIIDFDFYIPLDSTSQYFTDIPSFVLVKRKNGKRYFQVLNKDAVVLVHAPLLLVDWVPVDDAERILAMNPRYIQKIDVLNRLYYHGNREYGGIIHVLTKEGNMADLKLPESNMYLNYRFPPIKRSVRNQLKFPGTFFNTFLQKNDSTNISLTCPELPGKYVILIQQINENGEKIAYQLPFEVNFN